MARAKTQENVFKWLDGDPPPEPPRRAHIDVTLEQVATKAGHWARISGPYKNPSYARNMVKTWAGKFADFEFLARPGANGDEQFYVYSMKKTSRMRLQRS